MPGRRKVVRKYRLAQHLLFDTDAGLLKNNLRLGGMPPPGGGRRSSGGMHPLVVKELMRHSDLKLTTNLYTDSSQLPLVQGVAVLPNIAGEIELSSPRKRTQTRAQTGVAASHGVKRLSSKVRQYPILQPSVSVAVRRYPRDKTRTFASAKMVGLVRFE